MYFNMKNNHNHTFKQVITVLEKRVLSSVFTWFGKSARKKNCFFSYLKVIKGKIFFYKL
jgi:hypothetical protein